MRELDRLDEAIQVFDDVIARFGDDADPALRSLVANALQLKDLALTQ